MSLASTSSTGYPDLESADNDYYYVKLWDEDWQKPVPVDRSNWKIGGTLAAFISLMWYTGSNYIAGTQTGDIYAGKVANSLSLGLFAIIYSSVMIWKKDENFMKVWNLVTKTFGIKQCGSQVKLIDEEENKDTMKAVAVSLICGLFNAVGMTCLYIAMNDATANSLNISIWVAILSGNCIFALVASLTVFKDKITLFQTLGVFTNLGGVLIISLSQGSGGATPTMIIGSIIASSCLGTRVILSRYCTQRLDSLVFVNLNFIAELLFGLTWIFIAWIGYFQFEVDFKAQSIVFIGGVVSAGAEIFLFMGIERGVVGVVVSIAGTNTIAVGLLNWMFQGATPSYYQVIAISLTTAGILVMSLGDLTLTKIRKHFSS
jgi:drug/metabolite transporter (DMT)-like permease